MNLNKFGKILTSVSVGTWPSSYEEIIYWAAVSQSLRNTDIERTLIHENTHAYMPKYTDAEQNVAKSLYKIILK